MWECHSLAKARSGAYVITICAALTGAIGIAGCESNSVAPGPYNVVSSYLTQIAEGNYQGACNLLDSRARSSLIRAKHSRVSCPTVFTRCLPSRVINLKHDQSQLLYATIVVTERRTTARVAVRGTLVAKAIRRVSLAKKRGNWNLTSYGYDLETCSLTRRRVHGAGHSPRAAVGSKPRGLTG